MSVYFQKIPAETVDKNTQAKNKQTSKPTFYTGEKKDMHIK